MRRGRLASIASIVLIAFPVVAHAEEEVGAGSPRPSSAPAPTGEARPGVLNETAAVPSASRGWVTASGGAAGPSKLAIDGAAIVSPFRRIAVSAGATSATASPWAGAYVQFLEQESAGIDMTTSVRWRGVAPEGTGQQLVGRLNVGRAFGPTYVAVNGGIGQGMGTRQDVDYEAGGLFFVRVARVVRVGAEGRVRGEAIETYVTAEDVGRPVEVQTGGVAGVDLDRVLLQTLAGWAWPRGSLAAGPMVLGAATFTF